MDETGSTAAVNLHCEPGSTVEEIDAAATALASIVLSITGCVLVRQRIIYRLVIDVPTPAAIGSSIKRCGVFFWLCGDEGEPAVTSLPGIVSDVLVTEGASAGIEIDLSNADVSAFIAEMLFQGTTNPFGDAITAIVTAYRQSRV